MNAKEIAEQIANQWYEGGTDDEEKELCVNGLARIIERALIAYGDARLEQAAYRITLEEIEMPVSRQDTIENGILERASEIIRALKETK